MHSIGYISWNQLSNGKGFLLSFLQTNFPGQKKKKDPVKIHSWLVAVTMPKLKRSLAAMAIQKA